eukprot:gene11820-biopygen15445
MSAPFWHLIGQKRAAGGAAAADLAPKRGRDDEEDLPEAESIDEPPPFDEHDAQREQRDCPRPPCSLENRCTCRPEGGCGGRCRMSAGPGNFDRWQLIVRGSNSTRKSGGGVGKTGVPKVRQIRTNSPG